MLRVISVIPSPEKYSIRHPSVRHGCGKIPDLTIHRWHFSLRLVGSEFLAMTAYLPFLGLRGSQQLIMAVGVGEKSSPPQGGEEAMRKERTRD